MSVFVSISFCARWLATLISGADRTLDCFLLDDLILAICTELIHLISSDNIDRLMILGVSLRVGCLSSLPVDVRLLILAAQVLVVAQLLRRLYAIIRRCLPLVAHVSVRCALVLAMQFLVLVQPSLWSVDLFSLL